MILNRCKNLEQGRKCSITGCKYLIIGKSTFKLYFKFRVDTNVKTKHMHIHFLYFENSAFDRVLFQILITYHTIILLNTNTHTGSQKIQYF